MCSRRGFLTGVVTVTAVTIAGCGSDSDEGASDTVGDDDLNGDDDLGIVLSDHSFSWTAAEQIEVEVTLENRADAERSVDITVEVYGDDPRLDETLVRMTTPAGERNTSSSVLSGIEDIGAVTRYVLLVQRDPFASPAEAPLRQEHDGDRFRADLKESEDHAS